MIYSKMLGFLFRSWFGEPAPVSEADATSLVLVADGCGGVELCGLELRYVLGRRAERRLVRIIPWGHGFGRWHADLTDTANHRHWSEAVAAEVLAWREARPEAPIYLVGKSGGTWIVVQALEALPEGVGRGGGPARPGDLAGL